VNERERRIFAEIERNEAREDQVLEVERLCSEIRYLAGRSRLYFVRATAWAFGGYLATWLPFWAQLAAATLLVGLAIGSLVRRGEP
jgi:hypothetical protein